MSVSWKGNKSVSLISTFVGKNPKSFALQSIKDKRKLKIILQPSIVKSYNADMELKNQCKRPLEYYLCSIPKNVKGDFYAFYSFGCF